MTEPFPIIIDVDEPHLGSVLRQLDGMQGVITIHLRMGKNNPTQPLPGPLPSLAKTIQRQLMATRRPREERTELRTVLAHALGRGALSLQILKEVMKRNGFASNSASASLTKMIEDGHVKRVGAGVYRLTARGAQKYNKHSPFEGGPAQRVRKGNLPDNTKGLRYFVLNTLKSQKCDQSSLKTMIMREGYADNNMYTMVPKMVEEGLILQVDGVYEVTEKGLSVMSPPTEAPTIEAQSLGEMTNG